MSDANVGVVQEIYEAFGRGDVEFILDRLADQVDFGAETSSTAAPWYGLRTTKAEVADFFAAIGATLEVTEFTPLAIASNDTDVMAVIRFGVRVPATGKSGSMDLHHWWRFDADGKVSFYRGTEDTALTQDLLTP